MNSTGNLEMENWIEGVKTKNEQKQCSWFVIKSSKADEVWEIFNVNCWDLEICAKVVLDITLLFIPSSLLSQWFLE